MLEQRLSLPCTDNLRLRGEAVHLVLEPGVHGVGGPHLTENVVEVAVTRLHDYQLLFVQVELGEVRLHGVGIDLLGGVQVLLLALVLEEGLEAQSLLVSSALLLPLPVLLGLHQARDLRSVVVFLHPSLQFVQS